MAPASQRQPFRSVENDCLPRANEHQVLRKANPVVDDTSKQTTTPASRRPLFGNISNSNGNASQNPRHHVARNIDGTRKDHVVVPTSNFRFIIYQSPEKNETAPNEDNACLTLSNEQVLRKASRGDTSKQTKTPASRRPPFGNISNSNTGQNPPHLARYIDATRKAHAVVPKSNSRFIIYESPEKNKTAPNENFLTRFKTVTSTYPYGTGYIDIRGAIQEGDPEWQEDFDLDAVIFSEKQVRRIRVLIVPAERYIAIDEMERLILGQEFHQRNKVLSPGFSYSVLRSYDAFKRLYSDTTEIAKGFNVIFGFTYHLSRNSRWMTHHGRGWGGEKMVAGLARRWKSLLKKHSSQQLQLDLEFSYPAVTHFLEDFKKAVERVETYGDPQLRFDYN